MKAIWIRNGKVGGTSLEFALAGENGYNGWTGNGLISVIPEDDKILELHPIRISYLCGIREFKTTWPRLWERSFKFMLVRNPYARYVSAWKFFSQTRYMSLKHVLSAKVSEAVDFHLNRPQTAGLIVDGKLDVDYLVRLEDFQESFDGLCDILNIEKRTLPKLRTSKHRNYEECLDGKDDVVYNKFEQDFKYLGYQKNIYDKRYHSV